MKKVILSFTSVVICISVILGFSLQTKITDNKDPRQKDTRSYNPEKRVKDSRIPFIQEDNSGNGNITPMSAISESFEGTFPPTGWTKLNPDGGTGWNQQTNGTTPVPGFVGGYITVPPGGGSKVAFCTWTTGGAVSNDQWLITPQLTNIQTNDSLKFWLRYWPDSYRDSFQVYISTTTATVSAFTIPVFKKDFAVGGGDTSWTEYKFRIGNLVTAGSNIYIGFREVVADNFSDGSTFSLDLVSTTGVTAYTNDIATTSNTAPSGTITLPSATIAPKVVFSNLGSANQTNIPVTYKITGPVNYTSNKTIASLNTLNSASVTFDSTFVPAAGTYNVTIYCGLTTDQNRSNDTLKTTFTVYPAYNANYGGTSQYNNSSYFYANSTFEASGAPSQPGYCRLDTTGSTSLVVNSVASVPLTSGSLDDGHWALSGLGSPRKVKFMGVAYDSVFIGTNGLICFTNFVPGGGNWNPPANGLPGNGSGGVSRPGVYALWNDLNWGSITETNNRLSYKVEGAKNRLLITYDRAPVYGGAAGDFFTFQVVIDLQADTLNAPNSNIVLNYDNSSTAINLPLLIGLQNSDGSSFLQYSFINASSVWVTPGPFIDSIGVSVAFGPNASNLNGACKTLNLTALIQGLWNGSTNISDTLKVQIRKSTSPYEVVETLYGVNDASGFVSFDVGGVQNGIPYYIVVQNKNSVPTWSTLTGTTWTGSSLSYNFTTAANKAYGDNQVPWNGKFCMYSGDITQDEIIDASDLSEVENNQDLAGYTQQDVTGDDYVDAADVAIVENNQGVSWIYP